MNSLSSIPQSSTLTITVRYSHACRNIFNTIKTSGHRSLEKYTSHFIRKAYERFCVRGELETEQNCNILTPPALLAMAAFLSRSAGLFNRGPGGPASAGSGSHSSNWNTDFKLWSPTNWLPVAPGLYNYLSYTCFLWRHNSLTIQPVDRQGYPPISSTGCICYLHKCISHLTARPGRRSICYITPCVLLSKKSTVKVDFKN